MTVVWCSISAHGLGHAAQIIPILNELGLAVKDLHLILRTCVPPSIFQEYLRVNWELQPIPQDVGCLQQGPLDIDIAGTWKAHQAFHENWRERVSYEAKAIKTEHVTLVLSNISYLALAAASQASVSGVAIASLSWDQVLQPYIQSTRAEHQGCYAHIRRQYTKANHLIRLYPGIEMPAFPSTTDIGPVFPLAPKSSQNIKDILGMNSGDRLVLIAFGGVQLTSLPLEQMELCERFHFLVGGFTLDLSVTRVHDIAKISVSFGELMRQADVIMTKPGYATIVTAVYYDTPIIYVRRNNFVDEPSLVEYAHHFGRAIEMTRQDFESGAWTETLDSVVRLSRSRLSPPEADYQGVVRILRKYL